MSKALEVGSVIVYIDPKGVQHNALVTNVWGPIGGTPPDGPPGCNLVYVTDDETKRDPYGRQIERATSVVHKSIQPAHGNSWAWPDEV